MYMYVIYIYTYLYSDANPWVSCYLVTTPFRFLGPRGPRPKAPGQRGQTVS